MIFENNNNLDIFSTYSKNKKIFFKKNLYERFIYHYSHSSIYNKIVNSIFGRISKNTEIENYPFIPVRLFKLYDLKSIDQNKIYKILLSSGTEGKVSKIYLDKINSKNQIVVLSQIASSFIGNKRLPMLVIDNNLKNKDKISFSARNTAISGFSIFAKNKTFILNENLELDVDKLTRFLKNNKNLIFGFTSLVWLSFYKELLKQKIKIDLSKGILIHGGGWKKLISSKVNNKIFKNSFFKKTNLKKIINYYGMIEQTGSIFFECAKGFLHTSLYSDILIRKNNYELCDFKEKGMIQLLSIIPSSYPGNSILTEDIGEIIGEDDCQCGRKGKYFLVHGRILNAELRGCSDVNK